MARPVAAGVGASPFVAVWKLAESSKDGQNGDAPAVHVLKDARASGDGARGNDDGEAALG